MNLINFVINIFYLLLSLEDKFLVSMTLNLPMANITHVIISLFLWKRWVRLNSS